MSFPEHEAALTGGKEATGVLSLADLMMVTDADLAWLGTEQTVQTVEEQTEQEPPTKQASEDIDTLLPDKVSNDL
jgi:hypothetical protein